ncbi:MULTISPECIES: AbrB/MazE/SpoVT family DNA-binding domain-containing protein [unclassified Mesotoga]|jgi:AbrB family looped-hinge helix DNA binding protein|uniref:AbrB/MazE/SpoVT family DNA-binding domain-containing protein n=1 Tax=unclassified Mesotoga TaxID=1184398 RepID=UPI000EF1BA29|nr:MULTISPECIES: AbrB/MazE/SpoVT family DNA-binding domain-containing protein [unclassified Mesotoga]MDI9368867.1 AbrB/MazE/SpoVT family DNA-binding domain-containing protein [Thermotogota bacterium]MDD3681625.1 AbrB/MazE/SpoVT family DNA-binding domain-containing protein [Mesotoga sp.]MDD4207639.1 AbrB/MazE/SpoVT family DNA-binding domain-containing protein [Mesotoga sp.]MDD4826403.1 AbrB/MazE/SpoVT family DNA-binding domain-containing protein [Mesotoga sp.]MDD5683155.1 AbrB/MazE/SpoVT family
MKAKSETNGKYMGSVKVGQKGQIVIPKDVRDMFGISPGDTLILLADSEKGIAIERYGVFDRIADAILSGRAKEVYPDYSEEDSIRFAKAVKSIDDEDEEK